jgi:hypothetical protein
MSPIADRLLPTAIDKDRIDNMLACCLLCTGARINSGVTIAMVKKIIKDCNINVSNCAVSASILYTACWSGSMPMVEFVISLGANDWSYGLAGACRKLYIRTPSSFEKQKVIADLMIKNGASVGDNVIATACGDANLEMLQYILNGNFDVLTPIRWGNTLISAINKNFDCVRTKHMTDLARFLMPHIHAECFAGIVCAACQAGNYDIAELVLDIYMLDLNAISGEIMHNSRTRSLNDVAAFLQRHCVTSCNKCNLPLLECVLPDRRKMLIDDLSEI